MKNHVTWIAAALAVLFLISGCGAQGDSSQNNDRESDQLSVVATVFPAYEFARAIGGETADAPADNGQSKVWVGLQPGTQSNADGSGQGAHPEATLADALPAISIPDSLRGSHVAHSYLATGGAEVPDISGDLLYAGDGVSWFSPENNMAILQDTLRTLEDAGFAVSAFEDVSLILDSKATTWLLAVETGA